MVKDTPKLKRLFVFCLMGILANTLWAIEKKDTSWKVIGKYSYKKETLVAEEMPLENGKIRTRVLKASKEAIISRDTIAVGEGFRNMKVLPPFIFLTWGRGVHGETLVAFNLETNKKLFSEHSSWPVEISSKPKGAEVKWTGDRIDLDEYETFHRFFSYEKGQ